MRTWRRICAPFGKTARMRSSRLLHLLLIGTLGLAACEREGGLAAGGSDDERTGRIRVKLTDAALDDADVKTVYVTVTGVTLDGERLDNLSERRTVDISNYTAGRTIQYGNDQRVRTGVYDDLTLTFDLERDATGDVPGAYVERHDGARAPLGFGPRELSVAVPGDFEVRADEVTELGVDLDLRRAVGYRDGGGYTFGGAEALRRSLRVVEETRSGSVDGTVVRHAATAPTNGARVVYAFPRGAVTPAALRAGDFAASVTSARVNGAGRFRLSYLPAGRYELVAVDYADTDGDGRLDLSGAIASDGEVGADLRAVTISARAKTVIELQLGDRL